MFYYFEFWRDSNTVFKSEAEIKIIFHALILIFKGAQAGERTWELFGFPFIFSL